MVSRRVDILHVDYCFVRVYNLVIKDRVDFAGDIVPGNDFLRRHVENYHPQGDPDYSVNNRNDENKTRPSHINKPSQPEQHCPFILRKDFYRGCDNRENYYG
ncbi:MAG: hypothetical protein BWY65_02126 [Firmicutes bacterium ADurb.Bin373]|nr:MAG: hypothetical protein BWY65_02126 [Firmicutes bacterium ADurb.Bin373]